MKILRKCCEANVNNSVQDHDDEGSGKLAPKTNRTQDNSYPWRPVPKTTRTLLWVVLGTSCHGYELSWVRVVHNPMMIPTLLSLVATQVVITTVTTSGVVVDNKVGVMTTLGFQWCTNALYCVYFQQSVSYAQMTRPRINSVKRETPETPECFVEIDVVSALSDYWLQ